MRAVVEALSPLPQESRERLIVWILSAYRVKAPLKLLTPETPTKAKEVELNSASKVGPVMVANAISEKPRLSYTERRRKVARRKL